MSKLTYTLLFASMFLSTGAIAAEMNYPKMAFDATYELKTVISGKDLISTMRTASDGKGHLLSESTSNGVKTTSISDFPKSQISTVLPAQKMVMISMMKANTSFTDVDSAKKSGAKALGAKTVDGHPCHGFENKANDNVTQTWIGDDTKYLVHSETNGPKVKTTMSLKSWSGSAPDPAVFMIPKGYKEMKISQ